VTPQAAPARRVRPSVAQSGFTLLEVLVAFTILALIAVPAAQVIGNNLRSLDAGARYTHATTIARSVLDEVRVMRKAGSDEIAFDGRVEDAAAEYAWRVRFEPYVDELMADDPRGRPGLEIATVTVSWEARSLSLETLMLDAQQ